MSSISRLATKETAVNDLVALAGSLEPGVVSNLELRVTGRGAHRQLRVHPHGRPYESAPLAILVVDADGGTPSGHVSSQAVAAGDRWNGCTGMAPAGMLGQGIGPFCRALGRPR